MARVVITGGTRGLGLAIATLLAGQGDEVLCIARRPSAAFETAAAASGRLRLLPCDLSDLGAIPDLARRIKAEFGPYDGLVNNAGIGTSGMLSMMPDPDIESLIRLNTASPILMAKYAVRSMMTSGGGRIVNVSSIVASNGYSGLAVYSATKAALIGFTRSLAREVGRAGINVNAVAPGFVDTELTSEITSGERDTLIRRSALKRLPEAIDVAESVAFLLGPKARNITGTVLTVDAGGTA